RRLQGFGNQRALHDAIRMDARVFRSPPASPMPRSPRLRALIGGLDDLAQQLRVGRAGFGPRAGFGFDAIDQSPTRSLAEFVYVCGVDKNFIAWLPPAWARAAGGRPVQVLRARATSAPPSSPKWTY